MPFLLMKQHESFSSASSNGLSSLSSQSQASSLDIALVYSYFKRFVQLYIPNTLHTKFNGSGGTSLPYLKCSLLLAEILLQYHDRELYNHLRQHKLVLEMFATNWFLTLFTREVNDLALLYELWEIFLFERDKHFIFYFGISLLKAKRADILKLTQFETLLKYLTSEDLKITDYSQLSQVYQMSISIRVNTPVSFHLLVGSLRLFN